MYRSSKDAAVSFTAHNKKSSDPLPANAHGNAPRNALRLIGLACGKS